ncbi:MAG: hypothetical protein V4472_15830 [Pseudomonadota bacterium]
MIFFYRNEAWREFVRYDCQIINATASPIVAGAIYHATSAFTAGGGLPAPIAIINPQELLPAGCMALTTIPGNSSASQTFFAQQAPGSGDFWTGWISFDSDSTQYIIDDGAAPFLECDVPDSGSVSFVVSDIGSDRVEGLQINTYSGPNWTGSESNCIANLMAPELAVGVDEFWAEFINQLLD